MKALMLAAVVGVGSLFVAGSAEAGHGHHGHGHHHHHSHRGHLPRYAFPRPVYASPYVSPWYGAPRYHDTTHWDYHPPTVYRHGSHYHVMPGHYDLHRSGHWHH